MSISPYVLNPSPSSPRRGVKKHWIPVLCALAFICCTSTTFMSGFHTQVLVDDVWQALLGSWHWNWTGPANEICRKVGHFFGYGMVGLIFRKAWYVSMRVYAIATGSRLALLAASLGVVSTFVVAGLDEWHQKFVPQRVGSFRDVLIDTGGALFLVLVLWAVRAYRRRHALSAW